MTEPAGVEHCPICDRAALPRYRPFCSRRCADVDLNRWLTGSYAIPAVEPPDEFDIEAEMAERRSASGEESGEG